MSADWVAMLTLLVVLASLVRAVRVESRLGPPPPPGPPRTARQQQS